MEKHEFTSRGDNHPELCGYVTVGQSDNMDVSICDRHVSDDIHNTEAEGRGAVTPTNGCKDCKVGRGYRPFLDYVELCPRHRLIESFYHAAKAALVYADNFDEGAPVDDNCKDCMGRVFFTKGTPEPDRCWVHQLEQVVREYEQPTKSKETT